MTIRIGEPASRDQKIGNEDLPGEGSCEKSQSEASFAGLSGVAKSNPTGERHFDIRIAADGTWFHEGRPIRRPALVKLFATVLKRDSLGDYWLETPIEKGRIQVDDAPFVAVDFDRQGRGRDQSLTFRTNLDQLVTLDRAHALRIDDDPTTAAPRPYIHVRDGLEALVLRAVFYRLADLAVEDDRRTGRIGVWSCGSFFDLGRAGEEEETGEKE